ncbi:MAG: lysophospholipid acyltransferase family protein [Proteobacteria bacterium]|nr:lysophospholipid acyltransferase family protein [Pseudomonadota bacterium]MBU1640123.1 lysophospholipid acyltransferase family protein [Pseudomonadota bacterium]
MITPFLKNKGEFLGHLFFYALIMIGGQLAAYLFLYPLLLAYATMSRTPHRQLQPYLSRRFPHQNPWQRWWSAYRILLGMGQMLIDRSWLGLKPKARLHGTFEGIDKLQETLDSGRGAIIYLAHVGTWQTALAHITNMACRVHIMMAFDTQAVTKHFFELGRKRDFNIIDVSGFMGGMIEAINALEQGDVVLIMGDRASGGHTTTTTFLGAQIRLPVAAFSLAANTRVPVLIAFSAKHDRTHQVLKIWDVIHPDYTHGDRAQEMARCAHRFSRALENYVKEYPYQWYNFFDIWEQ